MKAVPRFRDYSTIIQTLLASWDVWRVNSKQVRARCPFHEGDNRTVFAVYNSGRFKCYKCGAVGDIVRLVMKTAGMTLVQAQAYVGSAPVPLRTQEDIPKLPTWEERKSETKSKTIGEGVLGAFRGLCPEYLLSRGFSQHALKHFEIGYDAQNSKIVLPVRDHAKRLVGLTYRLDFESDRSQPSKYWHDNFPKSEHLYGFHLHAKKQLKRLILVEGQLDVVRLHQLNEAAVAIMGDSISMEQVSLLQRYCEAEELILGFDNDDAGLAATSWAIRALARTRFGTSLKLLVYSTKDPGELRETHKISFMPHQKRRLFTRYDDADNIVDFSRKAN